MTQPAASSKTAPVVLITGAAGFIGAALAKALVAAGCEVRAGVRTSQARHGRAVRCDLDRPDEIAAAMAGVDLVVHAAYGAVPAMTSQCNALLEAMAGAGVGRLIHLSSIAVYGDATGAIDEDFAGSATHDAYGAAKTACEAAIRAFVAEPERVALILRPGIVYGAGSPFWIDKLAERIRCGALGRFGDAGEGIAALIHVDDLVAMVVAAVARLTGPAQSASRLTILNAIGPETPSWNAYFTALADRLGLPLQDMSAAECRRRQGLAVVAKIWRRLALPGGRGAALFPMPGEMALFARRSVYSSARAQAWFGFAPGIGLAEGLERALPQVRT